MSCPRGCCASYAEHVGSIVIAGAPSAQKLATRRDDADMDAYKRLRAEGHQPPGISGSADLERGAHVPFEIESGRLTRNKKLAQQVQAVSEIAKDPATFTPIGQSA